MSLTRRSFALSLAAATVVTAVRPVFADDQPQPFFDKTEVPLINILPPSPADDSELTKKEIADYKTFIPSVPKDRADKAIADNVFGVNRFMAGMADHESFDIAKFTNGNLLFGRLLATSGPIIDQAKKDFGRKRPFLVDATVVPLIPIDDGLKKSPAYPSGHTAMAEICAFTLSLIASEKRGDFYAHATEYGFSRYIIGVHYLTDIEASKMAVPAIVNLLRKNEDFLKAVEAAKPELRASLGLA